MFNGLLYAHSVPVVEGISIRIPTVKEVLGDEISYLSTISSVLASPNEHMVQLADAGIDFSTITSFDLFLLLFGGLIESDTSLIFDNLDLSYFHPVRSKDNKSIYLYDRVHDISITRKTHGQICSVLRAINHLAKNEKKPGNDDARDYMIERARIKQKRALRRLRANHASQIEKMIVSIVNTEQFKYDYDTVLNLTIFQFYESIQQIQKKVQFDNTMIGIYAGTVRASELTKDELSWI